MVELIVSSLALLVGGLLGAWAMKLRMQLHHGSAQEQAKRILGQAQQEKERLLNTAMMDAKAKQLSSQEELDREAKRHRDELSRYDKRLRGREAKLDERNQAIDLRERQLRQKERDTAQAEQKVGRSLNEAQISLQQAESELERIAGLTKLAAKEELTKKVLIEARGEIANRVQEIEKQALLESDARSQSALASAIQRFAGGFVSEKTISVVRLDSDEAKGRIIGREGRNIRSLEHATGVDVIIDDTPEVVVLSSFDPYRRKVAQLALERLVDDGRIHPARIEEVVDAVTDELDETIHQTGKKAFLELGLQGAHRELTRLVGLLELRNVNGQNLLSHGIETAFIAGLLASEIGLNALEARRAGILHDIGRCVPHSRSGSHTEVAADAAKRFGESKAVIAAIREHHDFTPSTSLGCILQSADLISKARPGARKDTLSDYINRLNEMEAISKSFEGVRDAFAIQAGTEVRVMVNYRQVSNAEALVLSRQIAARIEEDLNYPGEIRVAVIREARASEIAR